MSNNESMKIRPATLEDIKAIVSVHRSAFPGFFLSHLGPRFLAEYYRLVHEFDRGILLVAEKNNRVCGFVAGFVDPEGFNKRMYFERRRFIAPILLGVLRNPAVLPRVISNFHKVAIEHESVIPEGRACELSSIAVSPSASGSGIGKRLVSEFIALAAKNSNYVYLTTDADNNDSVNMFYSSLGFSLSESYVAHGNRKMNRYVKMLDGQVTESTFKSLPFALPDLGEEEVAEVVDAIRSCWITTGPKTRTFEKDFSEFIGDGVEAMAVNSATSGLHLALEAVGVGSGDEVITTPYTFTATAEVIRYLGAHPVFVDIDPVTFNIDPSRIEAAVTDRTKAIIPVHFGGLACDMDAIIGTARRFGLKVIEDAAHALPTTYKARLVGSLDSDATVFSFYATKTLATGEGGMVVTKNPEVAKRCRVMRLHGIDRDAFDRYTSDKPAWYYEIVAPGFKYNMTDIAAAMGIQQLKKVHAFQRRRQDISRYYCSSLADLPIQLPPDSLEGDQHAWHLYEIRLLEGAPVSRNRFIELMSEFGIGTSVHFIPLHMHPYWRDTYNLRDEDYPHAADSFRRAVSLPIYTKMTEEDVDRVVKAVRSILG